LAETLPVAPPVPGLGLGDVGESDPVAATGDGDGHAAQEREDRLRREGATLRVERVGQL
jgi:hypothetical protein